jgi:hypothetical protein
MTGSSAMSKLGDERSFNGLPDGTGKNRNSCRLPFSYFHHAHQGELVSSKFRVIRAAGNEKLAETCRHLVAVLLKVAA